MVQVYNNCSIPINTSGTLVSNTAIEGNKILLAQYRNLETAVQLLALRATIAAVYKVQLAVIGPYQHLIDISADGINFSKQLYFSSVTSINTFFWIKGRILEYDTYGDDLSNYLQVDYIRIQ